MISITALFKSKPEHKAQVQEMLNHLVTETRKETACARYDLHATEDVFILWEEWKDQPGLDIHNNQPHLVDFITKIKDLVAEPVQVYKTAQIL
ncbi:putative quinol monooxygenase [Flavobacterium hercynium]|uniref:Antibiotic biosynthesis monooxygenase n=1 Tax=Flavobacterium hercynium TaxID=387094 RepID=A0A226HGF4_9FLAO|nr:putative quinol monooxygenase [Flavobacterium hercynium]OXA93265.1 antibiotic biosynthesis monooxygenase [Flavobacterium hercynium]SMP36274.1 Quinol monooxygenase YgiN [Flavobacterium hercynium]